MHVQMIGCARLKIRTVEGVHVRVPSAICQYEPRQSSFTKYRDVFFILF